MLSANVKYTMNFSCSIHSLPKNILVNIFSNFKEDELLKNISQVCFQWNIAASDSSLWKNVKFDGNLVSSREIANVLRNAPLLESITLISVPEVVTAIRHICRCNTQLKNITIKNSPPNGTCIPESVLINLLISCTNLESITIKGSDFSSPRFFELLARKPSIKSINIGQNNNLNMNEVLLLAHNSKRLKVLKLSPSSVQNPLTDEGMKSVLELLKSTLTTLKLDVIHLGKTTFNVILKCTKLEELNLKNAISLTGDFLSEMLTHLICLCSLKIHGATRISSKDFRTIFSPQNEVLKQIENFKITYSRIDDASLCQVLMLCCGTLKSLNVRSCKSITSEICKAVKRCKQLTYLNLAFTAVSNECWIDIINSLPSLSVVVMDKTIDKSMLLAHINCSTPQIDITILENEFS